MNKTEFWQRAAQALVDEAMKNGVVITVDTVPLEPLAMKNYKPVVAARLVQGSDPVLLEPPPNPMASCAYHAELYRGVRNTITQGRLEILDIMQAETERMFGGDTDKENEIDGPQVDTIIHNSLMSLHRQQTAN